MCCAIPAVPTKSLLPFLCTTLFVVQLGIAVGDLPWLRVAQNIICKRHHGAFLDSQLPDERCNIDAVQHELRLVRLGSLVSAAVGSALVAFPLGIASDKVGRKPILRLGVLSILISQTYTAWVWYMWKTVSPRAIWAVGVTQLIGGGKTIVEAMVWTLVADTVSEAQRANRFQCVAGSALAGRMLGPLFSQKLLQSSVWDPIFASLVFLSLGGLALVLFVPETLTDEERRGPSPAPDGRASLVSSTQGTLKLMFSLPALQLLPAAVLLIPLASVESELATRLMPARALLVSLRGLVALVTLLVILPGVTHLLGRRHDSTTFRRDRTLACGSVLFAVFGSLGLACVKNEPVLMTSLAVSALGSGLPILCKSLLIHCINKKKTGTMFGLVAVGEIMGSLACEIGMEALFNVGLSSWLGLPFLLASVATAAIGAFTWSLVLPCSEKHGQRES